MDWRNGIGLYGSYFLGMAGVGSTLPHLTVFLKDRGFSGLGVGLLATFAALVGLVQFPITLWTDRVALRKPFIIHPYQKWEDFAGPGIDDWRAVVQPRRITAISKGHSHYWQSTSDGRNVEVLRTSSAEPISGLEERIDDGSRMPLQPSEDGEWAGPFAGGQLSKGEHALDVRAVDARGCRGEQRISFPVGPTRRETAVPEVRPVIASTAFCQDTRLKLSLTPFPNSYLATRFWRLLFSVCG